MKSKLLTILILLSFSLTSCSPSTRIFKDILSQEAKSVSSSEYAIFISKFRDKISSETLPDFQNIYYAKPANATATIREEFIICGTNSAVSLHGVKGIGDVDRYRLASLDFTDKINGFKVTTLYEV